MFLIGSSSIPSSCGPFLWLASWWGALRHSSVRTEGLSNMARWLSASHTGNGGCGCGTAKELCWKERLSRPEGLIWRCCVKSHSRSSLTVLLQYREQQVWEEGLLNKTGCRTSMVRKAAGSGYSSPKLPLQPENFILTHEEGPLSKRALSKPVKKGPCANKTRPKLCNQTSSVFKNISGSLYIPFLAPFRFSMRGRNL